MSEINIIELIEKNQITQLSKTYNNKLLVKVKEIFTESQQKLFISSFYCYLNYCQTNDFSIDLDNIWKWLGFTQKISAKTVLEKNFKYEIDYKILDKEKNKIHGGHNKEKIMLTVKTFKLFCLKAGTKKADEIHDYFIKLEEMLQQTISEECNELKTQLKKIEEINLKDREIQQQKDREKLLLRQFGSKGSIVYIIKVKAFENGQYIVKIGESRRGIQSRYTEHKTNYKDILLLDCFNVSKSKDFEKMLHTHEKIKPNRVNDFLGHEKEVELFLIGKELSYEMLIQIINENIINYNDNTMDNIVEKLYNEIDILKGRLENTCAINGIEPSIANIMMDPNILQKILDNQLQMSKQIQNLEKTNKEILEKLTKTEIKTTTNFNQTLETIGPYLQKINPETMTLIKAYESLAECIKETNFTLKRPSINKAVSENTIYHGFRWAFVERNEDPTIIKNVLPTKQTRTQNIGYIAKLNNEKTEIVNVYIDRKTAAIKNGYQSPSALDNAVAKGTISNNHYYILYDKCDDDIIINFEEKHGKPLLYKDGVGQYDSNKNRIREFVCKYDCIKQLQISDKTLAKALDKNIMYNNCYFQCIGQKVSVL